MMSLLPYLVLAGGMYWELKGRSCIPLGGEKKAVLGTVRGVYLMGRIHLSLIGCCCLGKELQACAGDSEVPGRVFVRGRSALWRRDAV